MNAPGIFPAALAGLLSFLSPCVLPLVPAYISFISGATAAELQSRQSRGRVLARSLAFSAGFTLAFTVLGVIFSGGAMFVGQRGASYYISVAGGILVILLGLNLIFGFVKFLDTDARLIGKFSGKKTKGLFGAVLLGFAFAAGWSPCIGPILASILILASREGNIPRAAALLFAYSAGFALPFLATGLFFDKLKPLLSFFTKRGKTVRWVSGLVLIFFGAAMAAGSLNSVSALSTKAGYGLEAFAAKNPRAAALWGAALWAAPAMLFLFVFIKRKKADKAKGLRMSWSSGLSAGIGIAAAFAAIAELAGGFSTLALIARWLTFSGV